MGFFAMATTRVCHLMTVDVKGSAGGSRFLRTVFTAI